MGRHQRRPPLLVAPDLPCGNEDDDGENTHIPDSSSHSQALPHYRWICAQGKLFGWEKHSWVSENKAEGFWLLSLLPSPATPAMLSESPQLSLQAPSSWGSVWGGLPAWLEVSVPGAGTRGWQPLASAARLKPSRQAQWKLPAVLMQSWLHPWLWLAHSSTSVTQEQLSEERDR